MVLLYTGLTYEWARVLPWLSLLYRRRRRRRTVALEQAIGIGTGGAKKRVGGDGGGREEGMKRRYHRVIFERTLGVRV